jgi:hypothetical protein
MSPPPRGPVGSAETSSIEITPHPTAAGDNRCRVEAPAAAACAVGFQPYLRNATLATNLTIDRMKQFVRNRFEDFVNKRNAAVIHKNMTAEDHDGPGGKPDGVPLMSR